MEVLGVILAVAAIALTLALEWLKRPRLEIRAKRWTADGPVPWHFACVEIVNQPLSRWFGSLLTRASAAGCTVAIEFRRVGSDELALPPLVGRWSGQPEPLRVEPIKDAAGAVELIQMVDPTLIPAAARIDVAPGTQGEEVAVAVLRNDGHAYGWSTTSYLHPEWRNPEWELDRGEYDVLVRAEAGGVMASTTLRLSFLTSSFGAFKLTERSS